MGSNLGTKISLFRSKRLLEGLRAGFARVLKRDLKLKGFRDRFWIDFGRVLGVAGGAKTRFSLESGANLHIFGYLKIRCVLDPQKPRFWEGFGSQVGRQNRSCWGQEGAESPKKETKTEAEKRHRKKCQKRAQHKPVSTKEREARKLTPHLKPKRPQLENL